MDSAVIQRVRELVPLRTKWWCSKTRVTLIGDFHKQLYEGSTKNIDFYSANSNHRTFIGTEFTLLISTKSDFGRALKLTKVACHEVYTFVYVYESKHYTKLNTLGTVCL